MSRKRAYSFRRMNRILSGRNEIPDKRRKRILPVVALAFLLAGCGADAGAPAEEKTDAVLTGDAEPGGASLIVTAWDTPREIVEELEKQGYEYRKYYDSMLLSKEETAALGDKATIYLCEGTYEVDAGNFIQTDCTQDVEIRGAGPDKTIIKASDGARKNQGTAINVMGEGQGTVTLRDLRISGFQVGIRVRNAMGVVMENLTLEKNRYAGIWLTAATDCRITGCTIRENGEPECGDAGYGLMLDADCYGNYGSGNSYVNNGNRNIVDYPCLWDGYTDNDNSIEMNAEYTLAAGTGMLKDPLVEARDARPGENSLRYEAEEGGFYGASAVNDGKMPEASGGQYLFLFDGALFFQVNVPREGYYRVFVSGGSDDGNNKCDKITINDGPEYLLSFPWQGEAQWQLSQPGLEVWINNILTPETPVEGFWFEEGENRITISANWGYCAYDCIYLEETGESEGE